MMVYPTSVPGNPVQTKPQPLTTDYCLPARPSRAESLERPRLKEKFNIDNYDSGLEDLVRRELSQLLAERYSVDVGVVNDQEGRTAGDYDVLTLEPWKLLFSYEIALSFSRLPHHLPLCLYLHLSYISYCCAESIHTLPYSIKFFCRLWRLRMPSRHDEKGGDGHSISAFSVTLAAWSSSSVKSDAGGSGSGCSAFGLPVGSTASEWTERWARRR